MSDDDKRAAEGAIRRAAYRRTEATIDLRNAIRQGRDAGLSFRAIAELSGLAINTVQAWLRN